MGGAPSVSHSEENPVYDYMIITELGWCKRRDRIFVVLGVTLFHNRQQVKEEYWYGSAELPVMPCCSWVCAHYDCDNASLQRALVLHEIPETPLPMRLIPENLDIE